jgi:vancomycin resistance protein YoaR
VLSESVTPLTPIPNRTNNIEIAASLINEVIVEPGEVFSFNSYVGPYTEEAGFKLAAAYSDGEVVQELGGGVCQVASALYYCSIYSNLEIVYRTCHLYVPSYIEYGLDATVSYDSVDYRFKNNTGYPIKILASVEGDELHVSFVGTNLSGNYVETETNIVREVPYDTVYVTDESLSEGESYHVTYGFTGYQVDVYRLLYNKDGTLLLRSFENESIYSSRDEVIAVAP